MEGGENFKQRKQWQVRSCFRFQVGVSYMFIKKVYKFMKGTSDYILKIITYCINSINK